MQLAILLTLPLMTISSQVLFARLAWFFGGGSGGDRTLRNAGVSREHADGGDWCAHGCGALRDQVVWMLQDSLLLTTAGGMR